MRRPTVRELRPEDELQVAEVDRLATADLRKVYKPTELALKQRSAITPDLQGLVAVLEGRVVGVLHYRIAVDRLSFLGLGVHASFRRRGVATALVQRLESIGLDSGCTAVILRTVSQTGNVRIFERLGFVVESEEPTTLFEGVKFSALSEVVMKKQLIPHEHPAGTRTAGKGFDREAPPNRRLQPPPLPAIVKRRG
jgi:ribosomal protein S18 acetylase RimI-like enzyme